MREKLIFVPLFLLISMGTTQAQVSYNQEFAPDVPTPQGFRTNRTSYSESWTCWVKIELKLVQKNWKN